MASLYQIYSGFSYGELDPKLAARVEFTAYNRGVKTASNVLSIPQGGFTRRFGTTYVTTLTATNPDYTKLWSFVYDDTAVYLLLFEDTTIKIYLENTLNATITDATFATTYPAEVIKQVNFVVVKERLIMLHQNYAPRQLVRSAVAANIILGVDTANDYIAITTALTPGDILPATFTTAGTLPISDPRLYVNTLYYIRVVSANNVRVYTTSKDAADDVNFYNITGVGTGVSNLVLQNTWTVSDIPFATLPAYDFDAFPTYSVAGFTFTASAVSGTVGTPLTITASAAVFTAAHVGGLFIGNGGIMRILTNPLTTTVTGWTYVDFDSTTAFAGSEAFLGEPAWSAARGYPGSGTFFQERLFLGGTRSIPNAVFGSTSFEVYDFDDSQTLDDNAISYYPSAGHSNYIKEMTSTKSLLVHSNTGNYSSPLTSDLPLTPSNFNLVEQNSDGISNVSPVDIDNQIIYIDKSSRNVKSMAWDIVQSSFMNTNISLPSSHLVQTPTAMDVFSEPGFSDGYYLICVNEDGTLGIFNSLIEQDVKGWTKASTSQASAANIITGVDTTNDYINVTDVLTLGDVFPVTFTTAGTLPACNPQLFVETLYYARVITANSVRIYTSSEDATNNANYFIVTGAGTGVSNLIVQDTGYFRDVSTGLNRAWTIVQRIINGSTVLYIEELDFDVRTDCSVSYVNATPTATLTGLGHLNGQTVQVFADGVVHESELVAGGEIILDSAVTTAFVGLQFTSLIEPLPVNAQLQSGPSLYQANHIRNVYIHYFESIGMKLQGYDIPILQMQDIILDAAPTAETGVFEYTLMEGWDSFKYTIQIIQDLPLPMTLLAIGYDVEVT
jgi:hypothetical protein